MLRKLLKIASIFSLLILNFGLVFSDVEIPNVVKAQSFGELISKVAQFFLQVAAPLLTIAIIVSGYLFITAAGNPNQIETAKKIFAWSIVGFIIVVLAETLVKVITEVAK